MGWSLSAVIGATLGDAAQLPIPCAPGTCNGTNVFVSPGTIGTPAVTAVQSGNTLTVRQSSRSAILNWASFDVSAGGKVDFIQPSTTAVALNRIFESNPSAIFGQVTANGQIYLINPNGFIFGSTARVNAAGLIASTLGITDNVFNAGLLSPQVLNGVFGSRAALSGDVGADGNPLQGGDSPTATVSVASGAQLSTPGGRMLLAAPNVQNAGSLSASDGQVVLAAGQNVYLQASTDPSLRGLIVEVDGNNATAMNQLTTATNSPTGTLSAARGNVTMVGLAVNQDGRISATTSVSANGSVHLEAGSNAQVQGGGNVQLTVTSGTGGTLELGPDSSIDVMPELSSSATAVSDQAQLPSKVTLLGQAILMHGGNITAPDGTLTVTASADPGQGVATDGNSAAKIRIDPGTTIDLSGSSVELPMSANLLTVQLRANELADDPTQRNGPLRGLTVYLDARVGSPLISAAAYAAALSAVPETIGQRTTAGGSATFESEGDIAIQPGATINVSGGHTLYDGGTFQTTLLVGTNGQLYDIGTANPTLSYSGVVNPTFTQTFNKWGVQDILPTPGLSHYESSYVEGSAAGSISIAAPSLVVSGTLIGRSVSGALQRTGTPVSGGQLTIGLPNGLSTVTGLDFLAPSLEFVRQPAPVIVSDDASLPAQTTQLSPDYLAAGGFTSTKIYSNGSVTLMPGVPLNLNAGGSLLIDAPRIDILSGITAPGGSILLENSLTVATTSADFSRFGIEIGNGVTLDVSGQWTNDLATSLTGSVGSGPVILKGGSITLSPGSGNGEGGSSASLDDAELVIGDDVVMRANGGAWLQSTGTVSGGAGGSITFQASPLGAAVQTGAGDQIEAFGTQSAQGGSFSLTVPRILIANAGAAWAPAQRVDDLAPAGGTAPGGTFKINSALFDAFGFSTINLTANGAVAANGSTPSDALTVLARTAITPFTRSLEVEPSYITQPTGTDLAAFAALTTLPEGTRPVTNVSLSVTPQADDPSLLLVGLLDVQTGASIVSDAGSSIALSGLGGVYVDGLLRAPGGTLSLQTPTPSISPDPGYLPNQRIELGNNAVLDASGTFIPTPNDENLVLGSLSGGGTISLLASRGSVVMDPGSQIDIAGASHLLDVNSAVSGGAYSLYTVPSAAGSLTVRAPESISLLGTIDARAGAGNYGNPAGGSLDVEITRSENFSPPTTGGGTAFPTTPRVVDLVSVVSPNAAPSDPGSGLALLGIANLKADGIDSLRLEAGDEILFSGNAPLDLARQLILDAPAIGVASGVNATIVTNYLELGEALPLASTVSPATGSGTLNASAAQIDLLGSLVLQNASTVHLTSSGDITLRGVFSTAGENGNLTLDGDLVLSASRVYPATGTSFDISTVHAPGDPASLIDTVSIAQGAPATGTPLSAGGAVSIMADRIVSSGTLDAPFGTIDLTAADSLELERGSVTSVSAGGLTIPYGATSLGAQVWDYSPAGANPVQITGTPLKTVTLSSPTIQVASGATVNLQGGGDVYAYEWVPGTGGDVDALGTAAATSGLYAVLPSLRGQFAPYDPQETPLSGLPAGASIYLSGGAGLTAGIYPLLPARDALIPGAYLVQVQSSGYSNLVPGAIASLRDGTPVIAGYLTFGTTGLHSGGYQGIAVWPGSYGQTLAQYTITSASTYFPALAAAAGAPPPPVPADAGALSIDATSALNFLGEVEGNLSTSTGAGSKISIQAPQLEVTAAAGGGASGTVTIAGSVIQSWKAGELVLGGLASADGTTIDVTADTVTVDRGAEVTAQQVILVANQTLTVETGAEVLSTSALAGGRAPATAPVGDPLTLASTNAGGAALLAVSDLALPIAQRTGAPQGGGTLTIAQGASVGSLGAISLDAPGGIAIDGTLKGVGASWSLASASIGFVGNGTSADALQINSALESQLGQAGTVRLASEGSIDLYAPVSLGASSASASPSLSALTLSASALVDHGAAGATTFGAKTLTLEGAPGVANAAVVAPSTADALAFTANELDLGAGTLSINGFHDTTLRASGAVVGEAVGGLATGGDVSIIAPMLTAVSGAQTNLSTLGTLSVSASKSSGTPLAIADDLGGAIGLNAGALELSGLISLPAGVFTAQAAQDIHVAGSATLDLGGRLVTVDGKSFGAEGGIVKLTAGADLTLAAGSTVDVSGAGDAPAGSVELAAGAAADIESTLTGHPGTGAEGGSFTVNAGSLTQGLTALAQSLASGGFTAKESIEAQSGDLILNAGAQLDANQIRLTADTGLVEIAGTVTAPNASLRGNVGLFGGTGVTIDPTGVVSADTVGGTGIGGEIDLGAGSGGTIALDTGSRLSASGASGGGTLLARVPIAGTDVALTDGGASLQGFGQIFIEPIVTLAISNSPTASDFAAIEASATSTASALAPNIIARLNPTAALPLSVRPAVDLTQSGAVDFESPLDLYPVSSTGQPLDISFRIGGSITIGSAGNPVTLSDGFYASGNGLALSSAASSSFRFVAGANLASPDPLGLAAGADASLTLAAGSIVRTGTGEIDLNASGDIVFSTPSAGGTGALVYTAGINPIGSSGQPISGQSLPNSSFVFNFPSQGGAIRVDAGGNVLGDPVQSSVTNWQLRDGNGKRPVQWGAELDKLSWNITSLGGGDVGIHAGASISELSAAAADNNYQPKGTPSPIYTPSGGLDVTADGDVGSSQFYLAQGTGTLRAGGAFSAIEPVSGSTTDAGSLLALGNAQVTIEARTGIVFDAIVNPTANAEELIDNVGRNLTYFFTYTDQSSVLLQSTGGTVALINNSAHETALMGDGASALESEGPTLPGTVIARSLLQDVAFSAATLFAAPNGQLELVAGRDINAPQPILVSDAAAVTIPSPTAPESSPSTLAVDLGVEFSANVHLDDPQPALIAAGRDINGFNLKIPKPVYILAGRDIIDLELQGENFNPTDFTLVSAGRDVIDSESQQAGVSASITVGGPGRLDVLAGRNVNLGFSGGITTIGDTVNPNIPTASGADLTVIAGLGTAVDNYADFVTKIIAPDSTNQALLTDYVESLTGAIGLTFAQASAQFSALSADQQRPLIDEVFFDQLSISGLQANTEPQLGFSLGYAAIDALFPNSRLAVAKAPSPYQGDIALTFSRIYTLTGGDITLMAPGGSLDVGLANAPANLSVTKTPSQLGIVAQGPGNVNIYSQGDVDVNSSRIFTLGGGNILIWSDQGSIDAGRGSKTSVSAPPPQVLVDSLGNVTLSFSGAVAGSGIRTIQVDPSVAPGNVSLIAPEGTVNAGDAGIGASGNINIAAEHVIGLDNIQFGGTSTGVPAQVSNIGVTLSGAASSASSASNASTSAATGNADKEAAAPLAQTALSWLDVFVTGLGEENCRQDDVECLKRQKIGSK